MKNKKIVRLVKYEVQKSLMNKWFIILNIILLIVSIIGVNFSDIKEYIKFPETTTYIEVVDNDNLIYDELIQSFSGTEEELKVSIEKVEEFTYNEDTIEDDYIAVEVTSSQENGVDVKITTLNGIYTDYYEIIEETVLKKRNELLAGKLEISEEQIDFLMSEPVIEEEIVGIDTEDIEAKSNIQLILSNGNLMILVLLMSQIQSKFTQEKKSKSSEYVLTNINAKEYMLLKVSAAIITFIIQIILVIAYYIIGSLINSLINIETLRVDDTTVLKVNGDTVKMIAVQLILSICSIFIQCLIVSAVSSKVGNAKEGSYAIMILLILNFAVSTYTSTYGMGMNLPVIINNIICVIPVISTYLIPVMMIYNSVSTLQIVISILLNLLLIPIIIKKCSKTVKNGILGYDSRNGGTK